MKQVILAREDLKMDKGKLAVQVAHASVEAVLKSDKKAVSSWRAEGMMKAVLKAKDEKELFKVQADGRGFRHDNCFNHRCRKDVLQGAHNNLPWNRY